MSQDTFEFRPSGVIEFERVEPAAVAEQLRESGDSGIDDDPLSINFGREKKREANAGERMLAGPTIDWLVAFPPDARPKALCERFPHVANRLAKDWSNPERSALSVSVLADDPRWGMVGFPIQVQNELRRLLK